MKIELHEDILNNLCFFRTRKNEFRLFWIFSDKDIGFDLL